jgi:hypothetical protein
MERFDKQPADVLDYDIDLRRWFKTLSNDEVVSAAVEVTEGDGALTVGPAPHPEAVIFGDARQQIKVWLGAGTDGVTYKIRVTATTQQDRIKEIDFKLRVREM